MSDRGADIPGNARRHRAGADSEVTQSRIHSLQPEKSASSICLWADRDLILCVLDFWGEKEGLGADRQLGDCRRPIFPRYFQKHRRACRSKQPQARRCYVFLAIGYQQDENEPARRSRGPNDRRPARGDDRLAPHFLRSLHPIYGWALNIIPSDFRIDRSRAGY